MLSTVIDVAESGAGWCGMVRCHLIYNANANCSINWSKCAATSGRLGGFTKWPPPLYHINFPSGRIRRICSLPDIPSRSLLRQASLGCTLRATLLHPWLSYSLLWVLKDLIDLSRNRLWMCSRSLNHKRWPETGALKTTTWDGFLVLCSLTVLRYIFLV